MFVAEAFSWEFTHCKAQIVQVFLSLYEVSARFLLISDLLCRIKIATKVM